MTNTVSKRYIEYQHNGVQLQSQLYSQTEKKRPGILLLPTVAGLDKAFDSFAEKYLALGYQVLAVDMYGKDMRGAKREECFDYMNFLLSERQLLQDRVNLALDQFTALPEVDELSVAAVGYCFGGLCVLDLARSGADLAAVISIHGLLKSTVNTDDSIAVKPRILLFHGSDDPLAPMEDLLSFKQEMNRRNARWELQLYGDVAHAFTNPMADGSMAGIQYNQWADQRSWQAIDTFLTSVLKRAHVSEKSDKDISLLFVCVENSCRSQMSQAFAAIHGDCHVHAYSAGSQPSGIVNPKAVASMQELEYDLSLHDSKSLDEIPDIHYDAVITMGCGDACPWIAADRHIDWQIPDPKHMDTAEFAEIRDLLGTKVKALITEIKSEKC